MAAIRNPIQAPGIFSAISKRVSRVTDLLVIVNAFMVFLPKRVLKSPSEGIIHENKLYVYLFMTFTIVRLIASFWRFCQQGFHHKKISLRT